MVEIIWWSRYSVKIWLQTDSQLDVTSGIGYLQAADQEQML